MPDFAEGTTFADVVEMRVRQQPEQRYACLVKRDGTRETLTYNELGERSLLVAGALAAQGAVPGDRVLILTPNCLEQVVAMLAAARSGLISVPVNSASAPAELSYLVNLIEPAWAVVGSDQIGALDEAALPERAIHLVSVVGPGSHPRPWAAQVRPWGALLEPCERTQIVKPSSRDPFQLLLTSGTTGRPKAVIHSHATRLRSAFRHVLHARIRDDDVLLNPFPAFHINCLDSALFPALVTGATAVIFEGFSASTFWKTVREEQATVVSVIPTVIRALNAQPARDDDLKHRVRLISGSLRPTAAELEEFLRRFGIARYETGYGLTEAGNAVTCTNAEVGCRPPSMGIPLFDRTVDLFDESRQPVPDGDTGEIVVKCEPSSAVMDGYWRDPEATQMAMTNGWLHTGDLARREPDGSYYFVGRIKEVIKRSGENVGAQEVEAALMDHPSIREIAVVGRPDAYRDEAVMAFIVLNDGVENLSLTEIRRFCAGRLAEFKMPSIISVVDDLPRGLLGKVDKKSLKLRAATYPHEENAVTSTDGGGSCTAP